MNLFYFFLVSTVMVWNVSSAGVQEPVSASCGPEYFESEDRVEALLSLEEFVEVLADLRVHSTADFISLKRDGAIPDGITDRPLQDYPDLKGEWSHLWDRVHDIRVIRGENPEERRRGRKGPSVKELETFIKGMVNELDEHGLAGEGIPEEEFQEEIKYRSQKRRRERGGAVRSDRGRDRTKGEKPVRTEAPVSESAGASQKAAEPFHYDSPEEREKKILELIAEDAGITKAQMATVMNLSKTTIDKVITGLKQEGRLMRIGANTGGYWQILQEGDQPDDLQEEREKKLLELIAENRRITIAEMATAMNLSESAINRMLAGLKREGRLMRVGTNNGYWVIPQKEDSHYPYKSLEENRETLLNLITENERITTAEMAEKMKVSRSTITKMIAELKQEGRLKRVGTYNGYWQILQEGDQPDLYESPEEKREQLLDLIAKNERITTAKMAEGMGLSRFTIKGMLAGLKREGRLARIGSTAYGYWQILQEGDQPDDPLKERKEKLLELTAENDRITRAEMATAMNLSESAINRMIAGLKREGRLTRVGTNHGYWIIPQNQHEGENADQN